jgi:outer membrane protein OmpA-like peptidoglycan-associated protein
MKKIHTYLFIFSFIISSNIYSINNNSGDPIKIIRNKHALLLFTQNKINFEYNSTKLNSTSINELSKIALSLKNNPNVKIQIAVHTDSRSDTDLSNEITQKRAEAIKNFLEKTGVNSNNLVPIGFGDTKILNKCEAFVKCTEAEHAVNRRVELKILNPEKIDNYVMIKKNKRTLLLK